MYAIAYNVAYCIITLLPCSAILQAYGCHMHTDAVQQRRYTLCSIDNIWSQVSYNRNTRHYMQTAMIYP
jgi:hypothetical protein